MNIKDEYNAKLVLQIIQGGTTNKAMIASDAGLNRSELQSLFRYKPKLQDALNFERMKQEEANLATDVIDAIKYQAKNGGIDFVAMCDALAISHKQLLNALAKNPNIKKTYARLCK
jgi:hypothetical protein